MYHPNGPCFTHTALTVLLVLLSGCKYLWHDKSAYLPHTEGRWVGRLTPMTLHSRTGGRFEAAVLEVSGGPEFTAHADWGGGKRPIVTRHSHSNARMVPPAELPMGRLVEVKGVMGISHVLNAYAAQMPRGDEFLNRRQVGPEGSSFDHILILRKPVKVLEE